MQVLSPWKNAEWSIFLFLDHSIIAILFFFLKVYFKAKQDLSINSKGFLIINPRTTLGNSPAADTEFCNSPYLWQIYLIRCPQGAAVSYKAGRKILSHLRKAGHKEKKTKTGVWLILCLPLFMAEELLLTTACLFTESLVCWCMKLGTRFKADIRRPPGIQRTTAPTRHIPPLPLAASGNPALPLMPYNSLKNKPSWRKTNWCFPRLPVETAMGNHQKLAVCIRRNQIRKKTESISPASIFFSEFFPLGIKHCPCFHEKGPRLHKDLPEREISARPLLARASRARLPQSLCLQSYWREAGAKQT